MIIGISAKMGCGKTTLAQHLQNLLARDHAFGEGVPVLRAFGDPLKQEVAEAFGFPLEHCYTTGGKSASFPFVSGRNNVEDMALRHFGTGHATVRELMQWYGTDYRRAEDKDYWTKAFDSYVAQDLRMGNHLIVHDVRFENEAEWVLRKGGIMLRLEPYDGWQPGDFAGHASETALDEWPRFTQRFRPGHGRLHATARIVFRLFQGLPE